MIARVIVGVGLFALGYLMGKEIGRAEAVRDQLRWAAEEDDPLPRRFDSGASSSQ